MDELILPRDSRPPATRTELERNGKAALIHVPSTGDVEIVDRLERAIVVPVAGDWILVEADLWASMVRELMLGRSVPKPASRRGARIQRKRDARN